MNFDYGNLIKEKDTVINKYLKSKVNPIAKDEKGKPIEIVENDIQEKIQDIPFVSKNKKRCPNGSRKNKITGLCEDKHSEKSQKREIKKQKNINYQDVLMVVEEIK